MSLELWSSSLLRRPVLPRQSVEAIRPTSRSHDVALERHSELLHDPPRRRVRRMVDSDDALELERNERLFANRGSGLSRIPVTPGRPREHPPDLDLIRRDLIAALAEVLRFGEP